MKKIFALFLLVFAAAQLASGQRMPSPSLPPTVLNPFPGYYTLNELTFGFGLGQTGNVTNPYDKSFVGFTTVHGYQINRLFMAGGGTGALFYGSKVLVPLFLSGRFTYPVVNQKISPYINTDAGTLLNFDDFNNGTKLYLNPVLGARIIISTTAAVDLGIGYFVQMSPGKPRDSFLNIKAGLLFIPKGKQ